MKKQLLISLSLFLMTINLSFIFAQSADTIYVAGHSQASSRFFREQYLLNDPVHYFDNLNDFITYQSETTGAFNTPDQMIFSIYGNSHKWNKYYLDGFRVDSRFFVGSSLFTADLFSQSLDIDYINSSIAYTTDKIIRPSVALNFNTGGLGGISPGTNWLINLYHPSAMERLYTPITVRSKMKSAGTAWANFDLTVKDKKYSQQLYAAMGTRMLTDFDYAGIYEFYPESFSKVQLSGQLPVAGHTLFDRYSYILNFSQRDYLYAEQYFSKAESAGHQALAASIYASKAKAKSLLTTGFSFSHHRLAHADANFARNIVDQDGEAFEPWYPDENVSEFSHSLTYTRNLLPKWRLKADMYNSFLQFTPTTPEFSNSIFAKNINLPYHSLYVYDWTAKAFNAGLLENEIGVEYKNSVSDQFNIEAKADITLDAMLINNKSRANINWQARTSLQYRPVQWFYTELNVARNRISYNVDDIRFLSDDYLNADIYYWKDQNADEKYDISEKSDFFTSTGGKYHSVASGVKQSAYLTFDLPLNFIFKGHTISFLQTYRKYFNQLTTRYEQAANGFYQNDGFYDVFFMNPGRVNYVLDYYPDNYMKTAPGSNVFSNAPFFFSSVIKYSYTTEKLLLSVSWNSYIMGGISTLGNGPLHNNLSVYSESGANPNINYKLVGRLDQERAYIARILAAYQFNRHFKFSVTGKFKDGQPFANFGTMTNTDANGNRQIALWAKRTKGINPYDNDFGSREDSFFNVDLRAVYSGEILGKQYELSALMYNLYDFGTELVEYTFQPDDTGHRYPLALNIPRGIIIGAKIYL